jgi:hypothetical protein
MHQKAKVSERVIERSGSSVRGACVYWSGAQQLSHHPHHIMCVLRAHKSSNCFVFRCRCRARGSLLLRRTQPTTRPTNQPRPSLCLPPCERSLSACLLIIPATKKYTLACRQTNSSRPGRLFINFSPDAPPRRHKQNSPGQFWRISTGDLACVCCVVRARSLSSLSLIAGASSRLFIGGTGVRAKLHCRRIEG